MPVNIKSPEMEQLIEAISRITGESKTEAVRRALEERHARLTHPVAAENRAVRLRLFLEQEVWPMAPKDQLGKRLTRAEEEAILGYGPEGV
jgi:antitoxin VapB